MKGAKLGVIVCAHVSENGAAILFASREEPVIPEDSGWQVQCGNCSESDLRHGQVWSLEEAVTLDPTLLPWLDEDGEIKISRITADADWQKLK